MRDAIMTQYLQTYSAVTRKKIDTSTFQWDTQTCVRRDLFRSHIQILLLRFDGNPVFLASCSHLNKLHVAASLKYHHVSKASLKLRILSHRGPVHGPAASLPLPLRP